MKKLFLMCVLLLCSIAICLAASISLSGQWHGSLKTDDGAIYPLNYNFSVNGDKLSGTVKGPHGDLLITDGEIHGTTFSFMVTLDKLSLLHSGKFYPDSVSLNIESGDTKAHTVLMRGEK